MIIGLRVGSPNHKPGGEVLYPVYYEREFEKTKTVYVSRDHMVILKNNLEFLFMCAQKDLYVKVDIG